MCNLINTHTRARTHHAGTEIVQYTRTHSDRTNVITVLSHITAGLHGHVQFHEYTHTEDFVTNISSIGWRGGIAG